MNSTQNTPYRVRIICKPREYLFIEDWLYRQNHKENEYVEIPGMQLNIDARQTTANTPDYMTAHKCQ